MPIRLLRVDERLIHGQVVVGWGRRIDPRRYLVVDDALSGSPWEQELYRLALDDEVETHFVSVEEARDRLPGWRADEAISVLLTRDTVTMARLAEGGGLRGERVNLGGLHPGAGRRKVRPWLHLAPEDEVALRRLLDAGVGIGARDLPDSPAVELDELLAGGERSG